VKLDQGMAKEGADSRICPSCGNELSAAAEYCPVCILRQGLADRFDSGESSSGEAVKTIPDQPAWRFDHYELVMGEDGKPVELGRGAMGVTYKAFDVDLQCEVTLKVISEKYLGDESARLRFLREARAAASVRHSNVASVFHLGETGGNYFYAMEFVEGETLENVIRRSRRLEPEVALEVVGQIAAGLTAIQKKNLVHRDIKPSNIMVNFEEDRLETVKIIDLGLAKRVTEETISAVGTFTGTPEYASPEQFAGMPPDIRSDLYSLGITLWEMLSGELPFRGTPVDLMNQHQHTALPVEKLESTPAPIIALLKILLAKDAGERFQGAAGLQKALIKVKEAIASRSRLSTKELRAVAEKITRELPKKIPRKHTIFWWLAAAFGSAALLLGPFFILRHQELFLSPQSTQAGSIEKSIAVLPFENISSNQDDAYFADGVQDEILNDLAKIAQLKVISRTSVMRYRGDNKRDLRQIANTLGVANVLEGTVRREGNHVRVSTELVNAHNDNTIWADSYDRDLTGIFAIQSEIAQTIARKLTATLSPVEKNRIEARPTDNLEAYDLYLRGNELILNLRSALIGDVGASMREAVPFLEKAVRLDPKFTLAYCATAEAHDLLYHFDDPTPERRALGDAAINNALRLDPDLDEVRLAYAQHLYSVYRDCDRARAQLAIAKLGSPNNSRVTLLEALIDRRQGNWEKAIQEFQEGIATDPGNTTLMAEFCSTLSDTRRFAAAQRAYDRLIELVPDQPRIKIGKAYDIALERGDDTPLRSVIAALPTSMTGDDVLCWRLRLALYDHDWPRAREFIDAMKSREDPGYFAWGDISVPIGCYSILLARLQGEQPDTNVSFLQTRAELNQKVQRSPGGASLLSQLAVVDALLSNKEAAIAEAKRAVEMLPISKDAVSGPAMLINLAVVYAWTNELNRAFETLSSLTKMPDGVFYGNLKLERYFDPLRNDPRFDKLLVELAPSD
jgi:serine/threonine protein kinase/cytochrome c-type biogenesis protein CcmH/NrfG